MEQQLKATNDSFFIWSEKGHTQNCHEKCLLKTAQKRFHKEAEKKATKEKLGHRRKKLRNKKKL